MSGSTPPCLEAFLPTFCRRRFLGHLLGGENELLLEGVSTIPPQESFCPLRHDIHCVPARPAPPRPSTLWTPAQKLLYCVDSGRVGHCTPLHTALRSRSIRTIHLPSSLRRLGLCPFSWFSAASSCRMQSGWGWGWGGLGLGQHSSSRRAVRESSSF